MKYRALFFLIFSTIAAFGFYTLKINFHSVIPNEVYRSAQLDASTLKKTIQKYGIKSVINLRGKNTEEPWYQTQLKVTAESGASHYDVNLTSTSLPRVDELKKLYGLLKVSGRPILVHCKSGADRSGLASAIALLIKGEATLEELQKQSSWRYLAFSPNSTGKLLLDEYRQWLVYKQLPHNYELFSKWVAEEYVDGNGNFYFLIDPINGQVWERPNGGYEDGIIFNIPRSDFSKIRLSGWAFDNFNEALLKDIEIHLDHLPLNKVRYGIYLPHLMHNFGTENYLYSGWELNHPLDQLENGCYDLTVHLARLNGEKWKSPPQGRICIH